MEIVIHGQWFSMESGRFSGFNFTRKQIVINIRTDFTIWTIRPEAGGYVFRLLRGFTVYILRFAVKLLFRF